MHSNMQWREHGTSLKDEGEIFVPSECSYAIKGSRGNIVHYGMLKGGS